MADSAILQMDLPRKTPKKGQMVYRLKTLKLFPDQMSKNCLNSLEVYITGNKITIIKGLFT